MTKLLISLVLGTLTLAAAGVSDAPRKTCCKTCCDKPKAEHDQP